MKKYYKKLNEYIEEAKEFYVFDEEGNLYSYKNNKLKALKKIGNSNSFKFGTIEGKDKSVSAKNLKNTFKLLKKNIVIEINEQLELNLNIKSKEVDINELFQLSAFDERFKNHYYFNSEGKLYSANGKLKELTLQKNNFYYICSTDNKIAPISPNYLRALIGYGFEKAIEPIEGEEWKWIEGYEGTYKVSNYGRMANFKGEMSLIVDNNGYCKINLCKEGNVKRYLVHQLVAKAFCEGYKEGLVVNHKDLDKTNNHYSNLEWITQKENVIHYYQNKDKLAI